MKFQPKNKEKADHTINSKNTQPKEEKAEEDFLLEFYDDSLNMKIEFKVIGKKAYEFKFIDEENDEIYAGLFN